MTFATEEQFFFQDLENSLADFSGTEAFNEENTCEWLRAFGFEMTAGASANHAVAAANTISSGEAAGASTMYYPSAPISAPLSGQNATPAVSTSQTVENCTPVGQSSKSCPICGDKASGRHFGVWCCHGCKSFFRRSIRAKQNYSCSSENRCSTLKGTKINCRSCRLQKCLSVGMDSKAVRQQRDSIGPRKNNRAVAPRRNPGISDLTGSIPRASVTPNAIRKDATILNLGCSLREQLPKVSVWANALNGFSELGLEDQRLLVEHHAGADLLFETLANDGLSADGEILIGNGLHISANSSESMRELGKLIAEDILSPAKNLQLDEAELGAIKTTVFFEPCVPCVSGRPQISELQQQVFLALQNHVSDKLYASPYRFHEICLLIDSINIVASKIVNTVENSVLKVGTPGPNGNGIVSNAIF